MEVSDIAVPVASAAAGGISAVWIAKMALTGWLEQLKENSKQLIEVLKDLAVIKKQVETIEKDINGLGNALRAKISCEGK